MNTGQAQQPPRNGPRFTTGGSSSWGKGSRSRHQSSGSDTDRDVGSTSRSDPSSKRRESRGGTSPVRRVNNGSADTLPDPAPSIPYWSAKRHLTCGNPTPGPPWSSKPIPWRGSPPGRIRTAHAALVLCLNIDVDPPDIIKTTPCAVLECWVDPHTMPSHKALEAIGSNLHHQFEGLSAKVVYKPILDPSHDDLKRFCQTSRRQAKEDAVLFYYNGHGVPKPTASGELWCFNRDYTQYIPVSLQELQGWLGSPCVYIWDCSAAGHLLNNFNLFAERRDHEVNMMHGGYADGTQPLMNSIQLAACAANEQLPSCPELPADVFTACLTSPIDIALRHFITNHQLPSNITADMVLQLPGDLKDRRTPLGELNWIFTAITDTIAWTTFSREIFTRLYRCDLLIASLFRNFLLAERIMKNYHCTPHTYPSLPATNTHPLWATWDLAVDTCLRQLPDLLSKTADLNVVGAPSVSTGAARPGRIGSSRQERATTATPKAGEQPYTYVRNRFFADQLTAFEVWISRGGSALTKRGPMSLPPAGDRYSGAPETVQQQHGVPEHHLVPRKPPDQLPIVLQVLLSQPHRLRALILLSQFVDLGPWAVHLVLTIGIFPYISKLLQAPSLDLRPVLIFIWARILAVDSTVQIDLINTQGYRYFAGILGARNDDVLPNSSEHKAMCSFILSAISRDHPLGQQACWSERVFDNCYERLEEPDFLLRQWTALCIAQMWDSNDEIKVYGVDRGTQDKLIGMLSDDATEVRAAALYALGTFMGASGSEFQSKQGGGGTGTMYQLEERVHFRMEVAVATGATLAIKDDASPMCRKELLVVISCLVKEWRGYFVVCAWLYWEEDRRWRASMSGGHHHHSHDEEVTNQAVSEWLDGFGDDDMLREENRVLLSSFFTIFVVLLDLSVDAYQEVATNAQTIVDYIMALLLESPFTRLDATSLNAPPTVPIDRRGSPQMTSRSRVASLQPSQSANIPPASPGGIRPSISRSETINTISSGVTNTLRRTSSFANAIKSLANNIAFPTTEDGRASPSIPSSSTQPRIEPVDVSRPPSPNLNFAQYTSPYSRPPTPQGASSSRHPPSPKFIPQDPPEIHQPSMDFLPCDVMEALMEEDMERLRSRRRAVNHPRKHHHHSHGHGHGHHGSIPSPNGSTFSIDSTSSSVILGLGTGAGIRDVLPLKSAYFDWCSEYFKEPQMRQAEPDEPGSVQYNYQVWRQQKNEQIYVETQRQSSIAEGRRWDRPVATLQVAGHPLTMAFHSYDQHLVVANETDMITVWDWSQRKRLNYFCNGNPKGTSITSLHIVNEEVGGIIVSASADGIIRLYRNYDPTLDQGPVQMVSAFRGLNEVIQLRQGSGVITDWKQVSGNLLVGGDTRVIKIWDAQTETQGLDLDTNSESPVTAIVSDNFSAQTFIASFADGVVRVFDRRLEDDDAIVRTYSEHTSWVQNVRWHPTAGGQLLSASLDGQVKLWDLRGSDNAIETIDLLPNGLSAFDVHSTSGVLAATSAITPSSWRSQRTVVQNLSRGNTLSEYNVSTGLSMPPSRALPSPFISRSSSLVFHPTEMLYGIGEPDGTTALRSPVNIMSRRAHSISPPPRAAKRARLDHLTSGDYKNGVFLAPMVRSGASETGVISYNGKSRAMFTTHPIEKPYLIYQIGSADPELAVQAAKTVMQDVSGIDLNCGCPKPFSTHAGMGAALLSTPDLLCSILTALRAAMPPEITVSCKIRLLPSQDDTLKLVERIVNTGISALTVHCRTRNMRDKDRATIERLREIVTFVENMGKGIAVIENGDCLGWNDAQRVRDVTGAHSVMIARAAESNPSCFSTTPLQDVERTLVPSYLRLSRYFDHNWGLTKFCVAQFKGQHVTIKKAEATAMRQTLSSAKDFSGMDSVVGSWTGKEEFDEIVRAIEANPPRFHRMPILPSPTSVEKEQSEEPPPQETTPPGTQNPEPPGSGAPFMPNSYRTTVPAMITGEDATTPTPGGGVAVA
ncbi:hypothetical protein DXG03_009040 [Asterophora parasitica]|uniref:Raptor N-terminal CASPase-like domain-containing protein n=1 Tax=Asterophora parasitica TaxID=117018 RepID=A0A9P7KDS6_9AGAR|nr:hypothetical protein DXG03_009040 [Asterophora parasitica]